MGSFRVKIFYGTSVTLDPLRGEEKLGYARFAHQPHWHIAYHVIASREKRRGDPESLDCFVATVPRNGDHII